MGQAMELESDKNTGDGDSVQGNGALDGLRMGSRRPKIIMAQMDDLGETTENVYSWRFGSNFAPALAGTRLMDYLKVVESSNKPDMYL